MAPILKRKRADVSYRESSSDEDTPGEDESEYVTYTTAPQEQQPSKPRRTTRRVVPVQHQPPPNPKTAVRSRRQRVPSYKKPSADEDAQANYTVDLRTGPRSVKSKASPAKKLKASPVKASKGSPVKSSPSKARAVAQPRSEYLPASHNLKP